MGSDDFEMDRTPDGEHQRDFDVLVREIPSASTLVKPDQRLTGWLFCISREQQEHDDQMLSASPRGRGAWHPGARVIREALIMNDECL